MLIIKIDERIYLMILNINIFLYIFGQSQNCMIPREVREHRMHAQMQAQVTTWDACEGAISCRKNAHTTKKVSHKTHTPPRKFPISLIFNIFGVTR
jgi:hypothetical protein